MLCTQDLYEKEALDSKKSNKKKHWQGNQNKIMMSNYAKKYKDMKGTSYISKAMFCCLA